MKLSKPNVYMLFFTMAAYLLVCVAFVSADTRVRGYVRKNGTYVAPHYRSSPNSTKSDNWSTKGNVNPYTGKAGTKNPDKLFQALVGSNSSSLVTDNLLPPNRSKESIPTTQNPPSASDLEKAVYEKAKNECRYTQTSVCIKREMKNIYGLLAIEKEVSSATSAIQSDYKTAKEECRYTQTTFCIRREMKNIAELRELENSIYNK